MRSKIPFCGCCVSLFWHFLSLWNQFLPLSEHFVYFNTFKEELWTVTSYRGSGLWLRLPLLPLGLFSRGPFTSLISSLPNQIFIRYLPQQALLCWTTFPMMLYSAVHVSTLPANRTERHIPAFPFFWDVGVATEKLILFPHFCFFEKHTHDTADLISGGDPRFTRSQNLTTGKVLSNFTPGEVTCRLECYSRGITG